MPVSIEKSMRRIRPATIGGTKIWATKIVAPENVLSCSLARALGRTATLDVKR